MSLSGYTAGRHIWFHMIRRVPLQFFPDLADYHVLAKETVPNPNRNYMGRARQGGPWRISMDYCRH